MATPVELRHLCLLLAAGGMVYRKGGAMLPASVRCALYMLVAFALRRGNLGRELLRGTPSHSHSFACGERTQWPSNLLHDPSERTAMRPLVLNLNGKRAFPYACCSQARHSL